MIKFLLEKGANPNANCYLDDCQYWPQLKNIRSTILWDIDDPLGEDYNEKEIEIENMIRDAGGREYVWDYTPWNYENIGKYVVKMTPSKNDCHLFCDNAGWWIGTETELTIEDKDGKQYKIDLSGIDGLGQWNADFQNNLTNPSYDWKSWKDRGCCLAKRVAELLPESVALFYLRDNDEIVSTNFWNEPCLSHKGTYIRIV